MGGQACVFYGAAQFSKDIDLVLADDAENLQRLQAALDELAADRIAIPPFEKRHLARGHAVHFRCQKGESAGLRVDVMTRLRDLQPFEQLWERRATIEDEEGASYEVFSVPDLVNAKKTQRSKDWPVIEALVEGHYHALNDEPTPERIHFWLTQARNALRLQSLTERFPVETAALLASRPLLQLALDREDAALQTALDAEMRAEQAKDRIYWEPLKREMEEFRREHARQLREESGESS
jgi:hypothetical protein